MTLKFALDTNCIIELDEQRAHAVELRQLSELAKFGLIHLSILGISASENQKGGGSLPSFSDFTARLLRLDLGHLEILKPIGFWDVTYWDWSLNCETHDFQVLDNIWKVLFPKISSSWLDYAKSKKADEQDTSTRTYLKWRNALCDAQIAWATVKYGQDVLVTLNTKDFQKNSLALKSVGIRSILTPSEALTHAPTHPY